MKGDHVTHILEENQYFGSVPNKVVHSLAKTQSPNQMQHSALCESILPSGTITEWRTLSPQHPTKKESCKWKVMEISDV